jgi:hypothetical protein
MITRVLSAMQGLVEYGAASGGQAGSGELTGPGRVSAWAADNRMALIAAVAGIALFWLVKASRRS